MLSETNCIKSFSEVFSLRDDFFLRTSYKLYILITVSSIIDKQKAVVCSKVVVLLLLICCFMYLPLFAVVLCWSLYWYALLCVLSSFDEEEKSGCFALIVVCLVTAYVPWLILKVPWVGLQCVIVVFPDPTHLLFQARLYLQNWTYSIYKYELSYDVASGSEITPCNKIDKPLVVYRFTGNVITSITTLRIWWQNHNVFTPEMRFQSICHMINRI